MEEIWKDIPGYEGYYQVSNMGRIKSLERIVHYKPGSKSGNPHKCHIVRERILLQHIGDHGYYVVTLSKGNERKLALVHRLIAIAFVRNQEPDTMKDINHKDGCRTNNDINNLEWCTRRYNVLHGYRSNKHLPNNRKPVICIDTGDVFISFADAARKHKISKSSIWRSIKYGVKSHGLRWAYYKTI